VHATFGAYPGTVFSGEVMTTDAKISDASRMITVRARIPNPDGKLLPGMYANITVDVGEPVPVVTVPQTAITYTLYGDSVLVVVPAKDTDPAAKEPELDIERRLVKPGSVRDGRVEIVSGIKAGEDIVVAGQNKIDQGSKVRIDNSMALKAPADRLSQ
jgi:membrane fusion protein (multidrug efflux system)